MEADDRQSLLFKLSETVLDEASAAGDLEAVDDDMLLAYAGGELPPEEEQRLEQRLIVDRDCRRRLAEIRGVVTPPAPPEIRRHLIERFARPSEHRGVRQPRQPRQPRRSWRTWRRGAWPMAAALVLAAGAALWLRPSQSALDVPSYEISIRGLADRRGEETGTEVVLHPDTSVVIDAVATESADIGIEVELYGLEGGHLQRLAGAIERQQRQGAVRFTARASELVGPDPGAHELFVVVGPRSLPAVLAKPAESGSSRDQKYHIYRLLLRLKTPDPPPTSGGPKPDD